MTQPQLFECDITPRARPCRATPEPIGSGPAGETCGTCAHKTRVHYHDKCYLKCDLVEWTHGAGTDIRAKWPACRAWQPKHEVGGGT